MVNIRKAKRSEYGMVFELFMKYVEFERGLEANKGHLLGTEEHREKYKDFFQGLVKKRAHRVFVAEEDGGFVGFIYGSVMKRPPVYVKPHLGYMQGLWVEPEHRRKGYGGNLVDTLIEWFKGKDIETFECGVTIGNEESVGLVESRGFSTYLRKLYLELPGIE